MKLRFAPLMGAVILWSGVAAAEPSVPPVESDDLLPLAGFNDGFYLRDRNDNFRLYPRGRINLDLYGSMGPGVSSVQAPDGSTALAPRLFVRRLRLELGGDFFKELFSFYASVDFGGQPLSNSNGKSQQSFSKAGEVPSDESSRFSGVQAASAAAAPADMWINVRACSWLQFMIGQYQAPFSMENRTSESYTSFMERNVAIRGFVFPSGKETGVTAWGEVAQGIFNYEVGVFGGDGQNRPQVDGKFDWMGRVFVKPFATQTGLLTKAQVGFSAHHGDRDPRAVAYDYPQITTGQGFALWDPTYKDSGGRTVHIIPSGAQNQLGGELRVPIGRVAIRGEAYYVGNNTREALDGYQLSNTERLGAVRGVGWYGQISGWPWGDAYVDGDPGITRPRHVDLNKPAERMPQGIEVLAIVAGINARYEGASRQGTADAKTPTSDITVYQLGGGVNYWMSRFLRFTVNYFAYYTPGSASKDNLAEVPGNLGKTPVTTAHLLHELGGRIGVAF